MFARKLQYGAHDGDDGSSYFALIELVKRKGGKPVGFVLYRRFMQCDPADNRTEMIHLEAKSAKEAVRRFWPSDTEGAGEEYPGYTSGRWEKTTLWLHLVAAGGAYERFRYGDANGKKVYPGRWAKVGTPAPRSRRRKKKRLQFGNPAHVVHARQVLIRRLEDEKSDLESKCLDLERWDEENDCQYAPEEGDEGYAAYALLSEKIEKIVEEIRLANATIQAKRAEMRYMVRRMFPEPTGKTPNRVIRERMGKRAPWPSLY